VAQLAPSKEAGDSKKLGHDSQELTFKIVRNSYNLVGSRAFSSRQWRL